MGRTLLALVLLATGCAAPLGESVPAPAPTNLPEGEGFAHIARLEDLRSDADGALSAYARAEDAALRARAAVALGRLSLADHGGGPSRTLEALAVDDADLAVRRAALFALGQRADPASGEVLARLTQDADASLRARAVEALAKLPRADLRGAVLAALGDGDAAVRLEAAHGPHRWARDEIGAEGVDARLIEALGRESDARVVAYALASLERRRAPAAGAVFARFASSPEPEVKLFAVRGLKALAATERPVEALRRALADADWRVQVEACLGLGLCDSPEADQALGAATRALSPHVRRTAWEALGGRVDRLQTQPEARALQRLLEPYWLSATQFDDEPSLSVQAAFLELELPLLARLRTLGGGWTRRQNAEMAVKIDEVARRQPPVVLAGLARALARIPEDFAREGLGSLAAHSDPFVAGAAIEALGKHPGEWTRTVLLGILEHEDAGRRLAAVLALEGMVVEADLPALIDVYRTTRGEIGPEVRFSAVRAAQKASPRVPSPVAELALSDADPYVRRVAREIYASFTVLPPRVPPPEPVEEAPLPVPGDGLPPWTRNPQVELRTSRGTMVFELFPAEAPQHVFNFLELARRGVYDGLDFHRVVPDFVVQGGDPRGDGNGGATWRGGSLREEITPRKYVRGSLGMPRNENPDSGGGQIFVTHRPTPHLDGRYTIFGQLIAGGRVLDELEVGDAILSVREL